MESRRLTEFQMQNFHKEKCLSLLMCPPLFYPKNRRKTAITKIAKIKLKMKLPL